jgi:hypothetical protein
MRRMASSCGIIVQGDGFCSRPANLFQWQTATDTNPKDQRAKNVLGKITDRDILFGEPRQGCRLILAAN